MIREKKTISGKLFEADFYPVYDSGRRLPTRAKKKKPTSEEQAKYNRLTAIKNFVRIINANFDEGDYWMTITYDPAMAPQTDEEAKRDISNYFRRAKTRRAAEITEKTAELGEILNAAAENPSAKHLAKRADALIAIIQKLEKPLKYAYSVEKVVYKTGAFAGRTNWHYHIFVTGGLADNVMEQLWHLGARCNCDNFQPERFGPEAAAKYMLKDPQGAKSFVCSRNMEKPKQKVRDGKTSARTVEKLAKQRADDAAYWEHRYPGYRFVRTYSRYNPFNGNWYVSVVMYQNGGIPPKWDEPDWITTDYT